MFGDTRCRWGPAKLDECRLSVIQGSQVGCVGTLGRLGSVRLAVFCVELFRGWIMPVLHSDLWEFSGLS